MSIRTIITCDWCKKSTAEQDTRSWYEITIKINSSRASFNFNEQHLYIDSKSDMCPECYNEWKEWAPKWNVRSAAPRE
jgi:hypothetical protein